MPTDNTEPDDLAPGYYNRLFDRRIDQISTTPKPAHAHGGSGGKAVVWIVAIVVFTVLRFGLGGNRSRSSSNYTPPPAIRYEIPPLEPPPQVHWGDNWEPDRIERWNRDEEDPWEKFAPRDPEARRLHKKIMDIHRPVIITLPTRPKPTTPNPTGKDDRPLSP